VIDGDTLVLENSARVRLLGIDAPEMGKDGTPPEFMALESRDALITMAKGKRIRLEYDIHRYDRYGRVLAYLFTPEGAHINVDLVRQGLARVYFHPPNRRFKAELLAAQKEAMEGQRGLWSRPLKQDEAFYLANRSSFRIHRPGCPLAQDIAPHNRVKMTSLKDAFLEGYSPCRSCKP
jgi:micrococcal nuclease